jgi:hypothetical protein
MSGESGFKYLEIVLGIASSPTIFGHDRGMEGEDPQVIFFTFLKLQLWR